MKRTILVALLLILSLPALGLAAAPPSVDDLRAAIFAPAASATPGEAPAGASWKSTCTVTTDCGPYSPPVSCSSAAGDCKSGTSASGTPFVKCDGVKTLCGPCQVSIYCSLNRPPGSISCTGSTWNSCAVPDSTCDIQCDGVDHSCSMCP